MTLGRTGRIGIHEGDEPKTLAKNFCKAFAIKSMDMYNKLLRHLEMSIANYQKKLQQKESVFKLPDQSQLHYNLATEESQTPQANLRLSDLPLDYLEESQTQISQAHIAPLEQTQNSPLAVN